MSNTQDVKPIRNTTKVEKSDVHTLVPQNNIFAFRTSPVDFGRWTITDISVSLPATPRAVFVQIKFPPNTGLNVSDNFSTVVAIATSTLIQVNVWRTDSSANPSINYAYDLLVIT